MHPKAVHLRIIGFIASVILTLAAYFIAVSPQFFHLETKTALIVIFVLAAFQATAQFIFFIDLWREEGPRWNLGVFISTILMIFIIIFFSIWIIHHLNYNMVP